MFQGLSVSHYTLPTFEISDPEFAQNGSIYDYIHQKHSQFSQDQGLLWLKQVAQGNVINTIHYRHAEILAVPLSTYQAPIVWGLYNVAEWGDNR